MLVGQNLRDLEQRRQLLLAQSGLQRATLDLNLRTAVASLGWVDLAVRLGQAIRPWLFAVAPIAGWLVARRSLRLWDVVREGLPIARSLLGILRR
jgi:hypothetical protein